MTHKLKGMQTDLQLLTRDGAIHVAFSPRLTSDQYAELMVVVDSPVSGFKDKLCDALRAAAAQWGRTIEIEDGVLEYVR